MAPRRAKAEKAELSSSPSPTRGILTGRCTPKLLPALLRSPGTGMAPQTPPAAATRLPAPKTTARPNQWFFMKSHPGPALLNTLGHQPGKKTEFHTGRVVGKAAGYFE